MFKGKIILSFLSLAGIMILFSACQRYTPINNNSDNNQATGSDIIFYYTNTCPHCQVVEEYINNNKIRDKISFQSKEVGENKDNASDLFYKAGRCEINQNDIGVPFLWDGVKCYVGQDEIINFFKAKTNAQ